MKRLICKLFGCYYHDVSTMTRLSFHRPQTIRVGCWRCGYRDVTFDSFMEAMDFYVSIARAITENIQKHDKP